MWLDWWTVRGTGLRAWFSVLAGAAWIKGEGLHSWQSSHLQCAHGNLRSKTVGVWLTQHPFSFHSWCLGWKSCLPSLHLSTDYPILLVDSIALTSQGSLPWLPLQESWCECSWLLAPQEKSHYPRQWCKLTPPMGTTQRNVCKCVSELCHCWLIKIGRALLVLQPALCTGRLTQYVQLPAQPWHDWLPPMTLESGEPTDSF